MRLIDIKTLELREFFGNQIPPYAILSHTWQEEEVSFQDWADQSLASKKKGYKKIFDTCQLAKKHGHDYVWVDTNCIDKSSSSELMEAINSMFKWYQFAQVCYVYLFDVPSSEVEGFPQLFRTSRWFRRGWTLQELLAPQDVEFYSNDWSLVGTKESLRSDISSITRINIKYLWGKYVSDPYFGSSERNLIARSIEHATPFQKASVSERFSWLSDRTTTRLEDMAYCMLGIFELNMPLLYGEGSKAFTRLQEEIMKVSDDHSLFCWTWNTSQHRGGFLSEVPWGFTRTDRFVAKQEDKRPAPYTLTNAGLSIRLPILHGWQSSFIGILSVDCFTTGQIFGLPMSGDLMTGRVCRNPFPPEPIPLCDVVSGSQESSLFVSENYSQQHDHGLLIHPSILMKKRRRTSLNKEFHVLLTFEPQSIVRGIETFPSHRFNPGQSSISIYSDQRGDGNQITEWTSNNIYEGVLIRLELQTGESESFMVASIYKMFLEDENEDEDGVSPQWRWHSWRVSPEDASEIMSGNLSGARMAIKDLDYAQTLDMRIQHSRLSISMAKNCSVTDNRAVCHMHLAQLLS